MEWTSLDTWIVFTAALSAMACALPGNFLLLRRMSMMGDAISHTVLPGLATAFLLTGSRDLLPMFLGAVIIGILSAALIEGLSRLGKIDEGSAMGVVFTTMFALGLLLIATAAEHVDLDPNCVLYGAIELSPLDTRLFLGWEVPRAALMSGLVLALSSVILLAFYKQFKITSFDPEFATSQGIRAWFFHYLLMTIIATTCVAVFESVGSILVIAMLVVPPACAHLLSDRLSLMILWSLVIAVASAVLGHVGAIWIPAQFGFQSTSTAGMMATASGLLFVLTALLAPRHGVMVRLIRRTLLSYQIVRTELLSRLFRAGERQAGLYALTTTELLRGRDHFAFRFVLTALRLETKVRPSGGSWELTGDGLLAARRHVRRHRQWEAYLAERDGLDPGKVHGVAERLTHIQRPEIVSTLEEKTRGVVQDPHGKEIPP
jgi:manganese/zinc/iron transport system permease protein